MTKRTDWDGTQLTSASGQHLEVWEPRWWQLGRWLHWWKFRRYHGRITLEVQGPPGSEYGIKRKISLRVIPSREAAHGDAPAGYEP